MRAIWLVRRNLTQHPGGDTTQIVQTAHALRERGVAIDLVEGRCPDLSGYDVAHLFHLDRLWENEGHCRRIRAAGRPAVLSPIWWPTDAFDRSGRRGLQGLMSRALGSDVHRSLRVLQRWFLDCVQHAGSAYWRPPRLRYRRSATYVLGTITVLLPNSVAEQDAIETSLGVSVRAVVVPNAAGAAFGPSDDMGANTREGVLCAGRIEPRKNQLALIAALRGTGIPLTLVGRAGRFNDGYYQRCRREAGPDVRFVDHSGPDELRERYGRARVHANVSWYETPGLASLEAALCGCAIVATPRGCTREYLGDDAVYCEPDDVDSIRTAVQTALSCGPAPELAGRVAREFTWQAAADKTIEAYRLALSVSG